MAAICPAKMFLPSARCSESILTNNIGHSPSLTFQIQSHYIHTNVWFSSGALRLLA